MRFKISHENIEIDPTPEGTERVVLALVDVLVPHWTSRLWFASRRGVTYPELVERSRERGDLRVIDSDHNTDHILHKFRVIEDEEGTIHVADSPNHLTARDRREICRELVERLG